MANKDFLPYLQPLISFSMVNKRFLTLFSNPNFFFHGRQKISYLIFKSYFLFPWQTKNFLPYFQALSSSSMANKNFLHYFQTLISSSMANKNFLPYFQTLSSSSMANKNFLPHFQTLISSSMANKKFLTLFSNPNFFFHGEQIFFLLHFQTLISCRKSFLYCLQTLILSMARFCILFIYFSTLIFSMAKKLPISVTILITSMAKLHVLVVISPNFFLSKYFLYYLG